jgi:nitrate reductase (cytochrome), electron transfer subunit
MPHEPPPSTAAPDRSPGPKRAVGIGFAVAVMVGAILVVAGALGDDDGPDTFPDPGSPSVFGDPIAAEAEVFRTSPAYHAVPPESGRRFEAHRRTHAMHRVLRAYPGAPPRVPHGLTTAEFSDASCQTCHERGGYVARFSAYAPVTPHPQYREGCLQCHAVDDAIVGILPPDNRPESVCLQCHVTDRAPPRFAALDWRPAEWPRIDQRALPGGPPRIPHGLQLRGNCSACHVGPGAVEEVRTTHPERANCRQCHVPTEPAAADAFSRPLDRGGAR